MMPLFAFDNENDSWYEWLHNYCLANKDSHSAIDTAAKEFVREKIQPHQTGITDLSTIDLSLVAGLGNLDLDYYYNANKEEKKPIRWRILSYMYGWLSALNCNNMSLPYYWHQVPDFLNAELKKNRKCKVFQLLQDFADYALHNKLCNHLAVPVLEAPELPKKAVLPPVWFLALPVIWLVLGAAFKTFMGLLLIFLFLWAVSSILKAIFKKRPEKINVVFNRRPFYQAANSSPPKPVQQVAQYLPRGSGEFGDAGFAHPYEAHQFGLNDAQPNDGVYLQQLIQAETPKGQYQDQDKREILHNHLFYAGENQLITIAPPGSGKGQAAIIPTLLSCFESAVMLDVKGELHQQTASYRQEKMGHKIIRINPFNMQGVGSNRFNPLADLNPDDEDGCALGIMAISQALVPHDASKPFFSDRARSLVNAALGSIIWSERKRGNVPTLPMLSDMLHRNSLQLAAWLDSAAEQCPLLIVRDNAKTFTGNSDMIESVKATALQGLEFLKLPSVTDFLSGHDFTFRELRDNKASVYIMIPLSALESMRFFIRLLVQVGFAEFEYFEDKHKNRVLMVLDEVAQLGYMEKIVNSYSINRGYNLRVWTIWQNLTQMKGVYPDNWESMLSASAVAQFFTPNDMFTAEWLSRRIGDSTVVASSSGENQSFGLDSQGRPTSSHNQGTNTSKQARRFMSPQDLMSLPYNRGLLVVQGLKYPVLTTRTQVWQPESLFYNRR
ncbi:type IV secretory system conjugative DNA transfer family protein [Methylovulum psychrotolerans]|nr:type IV secretory system conjugative DNA transfer family protein [Methylovulum psychrotolerans]